MSRGFASLLLVTALTAAAGCTSSPAPAPDTSDEALGACVVQRDAHFVPVAYDSRPSFLGLLVGGGVVLEADGADAGPEDLTGLFVVNLHGVRPVRGNAHDVTAVTSDRDAGRRAGAAAEAGMRLLVVADRAPEAGRPTARLFVGIRPDGRVTFIGDCAFQHGAAVRAFLEAGGRSPVDVLRRVLADPAGPDGRALARHVEPPPPPWEGHPPARRFMREAPPSVRQATPELVLRYDLPPGWRGFRVSVCQRMAIAIGECVSPAAGERVTQVTGYAEQGLPIWVQAHDGGSDFDVLGPLVSVPAATVAAVLTGGDRAIRLTGDPAIKDLDTLLKRGRDGPPPFTVTVVKR